MPFPEELLNPIDGPNPSGANLRYEPIYDKIKEARREEDQPPPGMTERDRKVADNAQVIKLTKDVLTTKTKDLQLAAWLTEALLKQQGFGGLKDGLSLCFGLIDKILGHSLSRARRWRRAGARRAAGFYRNQARNSLEAGSAGRKSELTVPSTTNSLAKSVTRNSPRATRPRRNVRSLSKKGNLPPRSSTRRSRRLRRNSMHRQRMTWIAACRSSSQLKEACDAKFADDGPSFGPLRSALEATRHVVHGFLQKKREKEPDPVAEIAPQPGSEADSTAAADSAAAPVRVGVLLSVETSSEPPDRIEAVRKVAEAAAFLRRREPKSPASYLMLRGLRWGELRAAIDSGDPTQFEAPPTELRKHLKRLALDRKFEELLEAAESAMALPCSRAWLDLQRMVVEACQALGSDYEAIARAIRSELKALVAECPQLLDATLMDDTPAANAETRAWISSLSQPTPSSDGAAAPVNGVPARNGFSSRWPSQAPDVYAAALQALREGQERKAFEILQQDVGRLRSGRERFRRKMQLVEMCISTSKQNIAQPILDDLAAMIETHKLDEWEDPGLVASALGTIMKLSVRIQADKAQQQKIFERICRLDPAQAIGDGK